MKSTIRILRIIMPIVAIICSIVFVPWGVFWMWVKPLPETVYEQVNEATDNGLVGIIVYIDQQGKAPSFYSAGLKSKENKVPADPHALFKIASISKLYIAVATAKLTSNKMLSLDDTIAKLLPELVGRIEYADKITLRQLVQHRSGIPNYTDADYPWVKPNEDINETLKLILDKPADFKPGASYAYSNTNYLLIGKILDKTLGYSHREYIKKEILQPLKLTHTFGLLNETNLTDVTSGYYAGYDGDLKLQQFYEPGGSMVSTAQDVGIFLRALNDGSLLTNEEQSIYSSIYEYEHTGLLPGYQSIARYYKDIDTVVVQFVNNSGGDAWLMSETIYNRIIKILRKKNKL